MMLCCHASAFKRYAKKAKNFVITKLIDTLFRFFQTYLLFIKPTAKTLNVSLKPAWFAGNFPQGVFAPAIV
jgi:hypothetical protein